ncbi:hypothetical protein V8B97DRAFT_2020538 [Scleroderma yunnanense]
MCQGWAYFVEDAAFRITCSNHNAVNMADVEMKKGCDETRVGMIVCARHRMRLSNRVGNLQYRERYVIYVNMDYIFASAWWHSDVNKLKVSYDIACQWYKKLHQWMDNMPPSLQLNLCDQNIMFLWLFSSNWMKGMDQTDGKEPEHRWANINIAILSINNMGLGHC